MSAYVMLRDRQGRRRRAYVDHGFLGYWETLRIECSGCTERGEMGGTKYGPFGCSECGYHGVRRWRDFMTFDVNDYVPHWDAVVAAGQHKGDTRRKEE